MTIVCRRCVVLAASTKVSRLTVGQSEVCSPAHCEVFCVPTVGQSVIHQKETGIEARVVYENVTSTG